MVRAIKQVVDKFGGVDILINNASAISLTDTENTDMKRYPSPLPFQGTTS